VSPAHAEDIPIDTRVTKILPQAHKENFVKILFSSRFIPLTNCSVLVFKLER